MDIKITLASSEGADEVRELGALNTWLQGERGLGGRVRPVLRPPREGELGGVFDMLSVALGAGGAGAALAQALATWLRSRRSDVRLTVSSGGRTVELDARRVGDVDGLIRQVLQSGDHPPLAPGEAARDA